LLKNVSKLNINFWPNLQSGSCNFYPERHWRLLNEFLWIFAKRVTSWSQNVMFPVHLIINSIFIKISIFPFNYQLNSTILYVNFIPIFQQKRLNVLREKGGLKRELRYKLYFSSDHDLSVGCFDWALIDTFCDFCLSNFRKNE